MINDHDFQVYDNVRIAKTDLRHWTIYLSGEILWKKADAEWITNFRKDAKDKNKPVYFVLAHFDNHNKRVYIKPYTNRTV